VYVLMTEQGAQCWPFSIIDMTPGYLPRPLHIFKPYASPMQIEYPVGYLYDAFMQCAIVLFCYSTVQ